MASQITSLTTVYSTVYSGADQRKHQSYKSILPFLWRHNGRDCISNHQSYDCLLNHSFRRRSKKTSKLRVTGLYMGNSPVTGEFPAQRASNAENISIWWRHHVNCWLMFWTAGEIGSYDYPSAIEVTLKDMDNIDLFQTTTKHNKTWWRHPMEIFSALLAICAGVHRWPVNSPHSGQWRGALMFSLICAWMNGWVSNRKAGDLRRNRARYDVKVMAISICSKLQPNTTRIILGMHYMHMYITPANSEENKAYWIDYIATQWIQ